MKDRDHPFLRPLWRRVALVAVCFVWAALELASGSPMWGMIALAMGGYGAWQYLYLYGSGGADDGPGASDDKTG
ncbi:DUF3329 domain-containing protein [Mesorhizobium sp. PUT5]|uniref:DUF3329 domain-containing protein n=1 Tax=Mesorhizobium sp. PUT5 TaxID=3454629 RepID=UPI003FA445A6